MKPVVILLFLFLIISLAADGLFNNPESVTYDPVSQSYFVSNFGNGKIIRIDSEGEQSVFIEGLNENLGIYLLDGTLFISCENHLLGYSITSGICHTVIELPVIYWLDGMTYDNDGNLYIVDCGGRIFKLNTQFFTWEIFVEGLPAYTQDCVYDFINDRLLIVAWRNNSPIYAADLDDPQIYNASDAQDGYFDGISIDPMGNVYVSSHAQNGNVYQFQNDLTQPPSLISGSVFQPAGLFFDQYNSILAVPDFGSSTVEFIDISLSENSDNIHANSLECSIFPNPFNPQTSFNFCLEDQSKVRLDIYNSKGQLVASPLNCCYPSGRHTYFWNASKKDGTILPSDCYFYKLTAQDKSTFGKLLLLK